MAMSPLPSAFCLLGSHKWGGIKLAAQTRCLGLSKLKGLWHFWPQTQAWLSFVTFGGSLWPEAHFVQVKAWNQLPRGHLHMVLAIWALHLNQPQNHQPMGARFICCNPE